MKKASTFLLGFLVAIPLVLSAETSPTLKIVSGSTANTHVIIYRTPYSNKVEFRVTDSNDNTVYSLAHAGTHRIKLPLNFAGLKSDRYTVHVKDGTTELSQTLQYTNPEFQFHVAPMKKQGSNKYLVSIVTPEAATYTLRVFDLSGRLVHEHRESIRQDQAFVVNPRKYSGPFLFELQDSHGNSKTTRK